MGYHGMIRAAQPGGHVVGVISPSGDAGQESSVIVPSSGSEQPVESGGTSVESEGCEIATERTQWLLVAPPVRAVKPKNAGLGSS